MAAFLRFPAQPCATTLAKPLAIHVAVFLSNHCTPVAVRVSNHCTHVAVHVAGDVVDTYA